ncbi:hypothetical protein AAHA92_28986 [Salvia divinorum]|uniref:Uncharacterized protein n=1 Tax=Salvia divinorum TaxID=28513 RepID=A0ABD1FWT8_SALDI
MARRRRFHTVATAQRRPVVASPDQVLRRNHQNFLWSWLSHSSPGAGGRLSDFGQTHAHKIRTLILGIW